MRSSGFTSRACGCSLFPGGARGGRVAGKAPRAFFLPSCLALANGAKRIHSQGQVHGSAARDCGAAFFAFRVRPLCPEGGRYGTRNHRYVGADAQ